MQTSMEEFSKSCFFGLRCLEILQLRTLPIGYGEIYRLAPNVVDDPGCLDVIEAAHKVRATGSIPVIDVLYSNISLLDTFIEPKLMAAFKAEGNTDLV
jgi:hypothetical protein